MILPIWMFWILQYEFIEYPESGQSVHIFLGDGREVRVLDVADGDGDVRDAVQARLEKARKTRERERRVRTSS